MTFKRSIGGGGPRGPRPVGGVNGPHEIRRSERSGTMAIGTLACPVCDAPVLAAPGGMSPAQALSCPVCGHAARVRDFLSLTTPTRPARVVVRVVGSTRPRMHVRATRL